MIFFVSTPAQAEHSFSKKSSADKDFVFTTTEATSPDADSTFIFIDHITQQDATRTQYPNHSPFPPEPLRDDTVLQVLKCSPRFDNRKLQVSPNRIQQNTDTLPFSGIHHPGIHTKSLSPKHLRHEILRI